MKRIAVLGIFTLAVLGGLVFAFAPPKISQQAIETSVDHSPTDLDAASSKSW